MSAQTTSIVLKEEILDMRSFLAFIAGRVKRHPDGYSMYGSWARQPGREKDKVQVKHMSD